MVGLLKSTAACSVGYPGMRQVGSSVINFWNICHYHNWRKFEKLSQWHSLGYFYSPNFMNSINLHCEYFQQDSFTNHTGLHHWLQVEEPSSMTLLLLVHSIFIQDIFISSQTLKSFWAWTQYLLNLSQDTYNHHKPPWWPLWHYYFWCTKSQSGHLHQFPNLWWLCWVDMRHNEMGSSLGLGQHQAVSHSAHSWTLSQDPWW